MKKIAIVSDAVYPYNKGGKEKRLYDITTRLARRGYEVTIYTMKWWEGPKMIVEDGVTLHAICRCHKLYSNERRSMKEAIFFACASFKMLTKSFDVVEVDHIPHLVLYTMKIVCVLKGKKMIATWHEVWGKQYWRKYLGYILGYIAYAVEKISVRLPNVIVSVSDHTSEKLIYILGATKEIITIPNGVNDEVIENNSVTSKKTDIVFAGRLLTHKHVDILLHAIARTKLTKKDISAIIVGDGPEMESLTTLCTAPLSLHTNLVN